MKIGRNWPCLCGSGKKYKLCCIGTDVPSEEQVLEIEGRKMRVSEAHINLESGIVNGFDSTPDMKHWIEKSLEKYNIENEKQFSKRLPQIMQEYNNMINEVNAKLPIELGVLFNEAYDLLHENDYKGAITISETILNAFPESVEAQALKGRSLFLLNEHPIQKELSKIRMATGKDRKLIIEQFGDDSAELTSDERKLMFSQLIELYQNAKDWKGKNLVLDILKECIMGCSDIELEGVDALLLDALCDADGRVRNNAVYTVKHRSWFNSPVDFFFKVAKRASREKNLKVRRTLCRVLLEWVAPITDWVMDEEGISKEYRAAIEMALESTGYSPDYYRASPNEKIIMGLRGTKTRGRIKKF